MSFQGFEEFYAAVAALICFGAVTAKPSRGFEEAGRRNVLANPEAQRTPAGGGLSTQRLGKAGIVLDDARLDHVQIPLRIEKSRP